MRVYLHTFGCKANQYDTELIRQSLELAGAVAVDRPEDADAAVINSCTVTHVGESKMRSLVRRIARNRPGLRTVVMGCAAAVDDGTIAGLPGVEGVVGGGDAARVLETLGLSPAAARASLSRFNRGARAWLKIQDGCDEHCTFCATTLARGRNRSRRPRDIIREAAALAETHEEIVLTGVHIGTYGADLEPGYSLGRLVEQLVVSVPKTRFRLSSVEATEVDELLADLMAQEPDRLAPHLHAPLQSGSDRVLKRMGRHWYTAGEYRERIERLAVRLETFGLGADVMVGFPGETQADYDETLRLIQSLPFTYLHVFPYSDRPGAPARKLSSAVPAQVAADRSRELRGLAGAKLQDYVAARGGGSADVVLIGRSGGSYQGVTEDYLQVILSTEAPLPGRLSTRLKAAGGLLSATPLS